MDSASSPEPASDVDSVGKARVALMSPIHARWVGGLGHEVAWVSFMHASAFLGVQVASSVLATVMPAKKSNTLFIIVLHPSDRHPFEADMKPATTEVASSVWG